MPPAPTGQRYRRARSPGARSGVRRARRRRRAGAAAAAQNRRATCSTPGLARILMPARFGGYELDFETWHDAVLEISRADASHGWCASLIVHHAHLVAQFPEECQQAVWADGPDVAIAASFAPRAQAKRVPGGYRVSGENSSFSSGVDHSTWVMVGAMLPGEGAPEWVFFMIPPGDYTVRDTWFTAGMRGTGSNTIVTDNVFVPETRMLRLTDLRQGKGRAPRCTTTRSSARRSSSTRRSPSPRRCSAQRRAPTRISANGPSPARRSTARRWPRRPRCRCRWRAPRPISTPPRCCCAAPRRIPDVPAEADAAACWRARSAISRGSRKCRSPPSTR